jgi:methylenetetrahydrofolate reductase (NADH)
MPPSVPPVSARASKTAVKRQPTTAALIEQARMEIIPGEGVAERVRANVPRELSLSVTCLTRHGPDRAVELACELADAGYRVMPHLAAHAVQSRDHLRRLATRCTEHRIDEFLAVGGDGAHDAGPYSWAGALLEDLRSIAPQARVTVAAYPQGHPRFSDDQLWAALRRKLELGAAAVVTQMCFDHRAYAVWLEKLDADVPVWLGCPGLVSRTRVASIARRIGVADAARFARGNRRALARLTVARHFRPHDLIADVLADAGAASAHFAGVHLYSFNEIERTVSWRDGYLPRSRTG